jgi:hypothetical protein
MASIILSLRLLARALGKNLVNAFVSWNTYQFSYLYRVLLVTGAAAAAAGAEDADSAPAAATAKTLASNTDKAW